MAVPLNGAETLNVLGQSNNSSPAATTQQVYVRDIAQAPQLVNAGVVAAGTTQSGATVLNSAGLVQVATGTANQGVLLPASLAGKQIEILNSTGNALKVYPNGTDTVDGGSASAAVTISSATRGAIFTCYVAGAWISNVIGAATS